MPVTCRYNDVDMAQVPPGKRRIGMVFQNYALYPHVTARSNVLSYYLFRKKTPALTAEARARFARTSELMGVELAYLFDRKPTKLSGGEKQRVALRALHHPRRRRLPRRRALRQSRSGPCARSIASTSSACCESSASPPSTSPTTITRPCCWPMCWP